MGSWYSRYKWDIPVLHVDGSYWAKHRIDEEGAIEALSEAAERRAAGKGEGETFSAREGEPDAGEMERRQAERRDAADAGRE